MTFDRDELTTLLGQQWDAIAALVDGLPENRWRTPSPLPGWTVFDVVAHVVGTESWLLGEQPPAHDPMRPKTDVRTLPHVRNEVAVLNEIWIDRLRPLPGARLLELFGEVTDRRRAALAKLSDEEWSVPTQSPIGQVPYARFMRVRLFDCWMHELDVADALGVSVDEGGRRGTVAFEEFLVSLPRAIGKLGKAPDGSRIELELTGPQTRTLRVQVDGRAGYVDSFDGDPTVRIGLNSSLLVRLGGGRTTADAHSDEIEIAGDEELGRRLVRNLAFTL
ncbi:maleylpyruvate isomerase family mycothiol-dependent enzyme [Nocardia sp. NPDC127579]|uniref:maleylpyruvate isomerase family mycothiol-dependent enzyme n=1 Tax=Nocardia sp. NPDC127579 TaxID=3345402 RepID=UPI00363CB3F8